MHWPRQIGKRQFLSVECQQQKLNHESVREELNMTPLFLENLPCLPRGVFPGESGLLDFYHSDIAVPQKSCWFHISKKFQVFGGFLVSEPGRRPDQLLLLQWWLDCDFTHFSDIWNDTGLLMKNYLIFSTWNAKCPIFLGNFTPKTSNFWLKNRALGFPGIYIITTTNHITENLERLGRIFL